MTNRIAIFLLILMIGSCSTDIRNMAIKYNSQGAVHNVAEAFAEAYYRMPVSLDEIKNFCSDFREAYLSEGTMIGMFEEWRDKCLKNIFRKNMSCWSHIKTLALSMIENIRLDAVYMDRHAF